MAMNINEFMKKRAEESAREAKKSPKQDQALLNPDEALQARIEALLKDALAGKPDLDMDFAELLQSVPEDKRDDVIAMLRSRLEQISEERSIVKSDLTPQEEALLAQLKANEESVVANFLHEKRMEKIRRMFMLNPHLWEQVVSISEQLQRRGVLTELQRISTEALGEIVARPGQNPEHSKGTDRKR